MYVLLVTAEVKDGKEDQFVAVSLVDAERSLSEEPGCLRFEVFQDRELPTRFFLCEVYRDEASFLAHKATAHCREWKEAVGDTLAHPLTKVSLRGIPLPSAPAQLRGAVERKR